MSISAYNVAIGAVWLWLFAATFGPNSPLRDTAAAVAVGISLALAVVWLLVPRLSRGFRAAYLATGSFACVLAGLSTTDLRLSLASMFPLTLLGIFAATLCGRRMLMAQLAFTAVALAVVVGVLAQGEVGDIVSYVLVAVMMSAVLPVMFHVCLESMCSSRQPPSVPVPATVLRNHELMPAVIAGLAPLNRRPRIVVLHIHLDQYDESADFNHVVGEGIVHNVAERLAHGLRTGDLIAHIDAGEFCAVTATSVEGIDIVAERLRNMIFDPGDPIPVSASVGVAFAATPLHRVTAPAVIDTLTRRAKAAMISARDAGGDRIAIDASSPVE